MSIQQLSPDQLYKKCNLDDFSFKTTDELEALESVYLGQQRALASTEFGIKMKKGTMKLSSILVAINSLTGSSFVLNAAVHLTHKINAKLKAVFIEESDWFEVSKFSFTQQVSSYTGEVIPFTETSVTEQSRVLGTLLQRLISSMSEQVKIKYSYKSFRGIVHLKLIPNTVLIL